MAEAMASFSGTSIPLRILTMPKPPLLADRLYNITMKRVAAMS